VDNLKAEIAVGSLARRLLKSGVAIVTRRERGWEVLPTAALWPMTSAIKKPTSRWVHKMTPPRSSAVGVISLSADRGDSMPEMDVIKNYACVKKGGKALTG
jgi:hypothetical protein